VPSIHPTLLSPQAADYRPFGGGPDEVEAASGDVRGTCIAIGLTRARALLAGNPGETAAQFDRALGADLAHWRG
jgi:hypothetical protein